MKGQKKKKNNSLRTVGSHSCPVSWMQEGQICDDAVGPSKLLPTLHVALSKRNNLNTLKQRDNFGGPDPDGTIENETKEAEYDVDSM
jgi:hypothetical protein